MKRTCSCSSNRNNRRGCLVSRLCRSSRGWIAFYKPRWIMESPAWTLGRACKLCNASVNIPIGEQPQRYSTRTSGAGQPESTRARRGSFAQRGVCGPGAARGIGCRPDASAHPPSMWWWLRGTSMPKKRLVLAPILCVAVGVWTLHAAMWLLKVTRLNPPTLWVMRRVDSL